MLNVVTRRDSLAHRFATVPGAVPSAQAVAQILVALRGTAQLSDPAATTLGLWDAVRFDGALTTTTPDEALLAHITLTRRGSDAAV